LAELLGSAFLAAIVVGSGIAAQQLSPGNTGLELLENAAATAAGLYAIILMFGPVSGGHFNPVVSFADAIFGGITWRTASAYLPAQVAGCVGGAVIANVMFSKAAVSISTHHRASSGHFLSEVVATLGLILVIFSLARSGRSGSAATAVGAYIGAAYFFTSSTSFANPAITVGRMFSNTFAGISPSSVPSFVAAQVVGGALAVVVLTVLYPDITPATSRPPKPPTSCFLTRKVQSLLTPLTFQALLQGTPCDRPPDRSVPVYPQLRAQPGGTGLARPLRPGLHPG
jgi:arsenate reductase